MSKLVAIYSFLHSKSPSLFKRKNVSCVKFVNKTFPSSIFFFFFLSSKIRISFMMFLRLLCSKKKKKTQVLSERNEKEIDRWQRARCSFVLLRPIQTLRLLSKTLAFRAYLPSLLQNPTIVFSKNVVQILVFFFFNFKTQKNISSF